MCGSHMTLGTQPIMEVKKVDSLETLTVCETSCGNRTRIEYLVNTGDSGKDYIGQTRKVCGWSKTVRKQGGNTILFIALTDGSCVGTLQCVVTQESVDNFDELKKCGVSCAFEIYGEITASPAAGQKIELHVNKPDHYAKLIGGCDAAKFPLAKKKHTKEFLRDIAHLRPRSYIIGAVARVRNELTFATHTFFQKRGFKYIHTPIITTADCEGAGELFQVTTLIGEGKYKDIPTVKDKGYTVDVAKDFFQKAAFLSCSGQLNVENYAQALCDVYTFGPTFRAENSHTSRHLAEFWMIEPEMAFCDLNGNMEIAEAYVKYCINWCLEKCMTDLVYFNDNEETDLIDRLRNVVDNNFVRLSYTEAIKLLEEHVAAEKITFEQKVEWGMDMGSEHERYLCEKVYKMPVIVYNYPKDIKAFYMKRNDDGKTVQAMDILVPKIGELIGGSAREENLDLLDAQIKEKGLNVKDYWWYRELRQYGTTPHAGFGLGFERLVMMVTGMDNIRDVIPFPRAAGLAEF